MRISITNGAGNDPPHHYMVVDGVGMLVDLAGVSGSLVDPSIASVTWGPVLNNGAAREAGVITRQDGSLRSFFDKAALKPYLAAYEARKAELLAAGPKAAS